MAKKKNRVVVEVEKLVACIPGYEDTNLPKGIYHKITKRFYHKSGNELRLEEEQRTKQLPVWNLATV